MLKVNLFHPDVRENPYPTYQILRTEDPIHKSVIGDFWILTRYCDVKSALLDGRFSSNRRPQSIKAKHQYVLEKGGDLTTLLQASNAQLFFIDPPDHTRLRRLVRQAFSPNVVERMRPEIQEIVDALLSKIRHTGRMDIIGDFAGPLPASVIAKLLGVPPEDHQRLREWSRDLSYLLDPLLSLEQYTHLNSIAEKFKAYFSTLIAERERRPQKDLISSLILARDQGDKLREDEVWSICMMLFGTGEETTVNTIGNGMLALLQDPVALGHLKRNPCLINSAIEELLRFDAPTQLTFRVAVEDVEFGGKTIPAGEDVVLCLGSANRDPAEFSDPDRLDFSRTNNHHLAFGEGVHFCLGASLARAQSQIAINTLIQEFHRMKIQTKNLERRENISLRGLKSLPVSFTL